LKEKKIFDLKKERMKVSPMEYARGTKTTANMRISHHPRCWKSERWLKSRMIR
jgi:hypothetical protein